MLALALLGMLAAAYGLSLHYSGDSSHFCDIGTSFSCDKVNKSPWSTLFGVPVALLGMLAYAAVLLLVLKRASVERALAFTRKDFFGYMLVFVCAMLLFQAYLTAMEITQIHTYCLVCLVSQATVIALACVVFAAWRSS